MKKPTLFFIAILIAMAGTAQAQTASRQLFGENPPEIELPEPAAKAMPREADGHYGDALKNKALPQIGQHIIGKDRFSSRVGAMQEYRQVLNALRQMGIKVIDSPEGGVYSYLEPNHDGMASYTRYGYIIEYEGKQLAMDSFSTPRVSMSQWQLDAAISALKRFGAYVISSNSNHISYIRYKSKPTLLYTYDFADSQRDAERMKSNVESNLRGKGFETVFSHIYEEKYYDQSWMGWKSNYHVNVIYLSIVD